MFEPKSVGELAARYNVEAAALLGDDKHLRFCVVGGGGYLGALLAHALATAGHTVVCVDVHYPQCYRFESDSVNRVEASIEDYASLERAVAGCECVFHLAAYGMTGRESLDGGKMRRINVAGTENVVRACRSRAVPKLVYASTTDVCWCDDGAVKGLAEEQLPYLKDHQHADEYGRTKTRAEITVLRAGGPAVRTCALRFHGIYGPGERRTTKRVVDLVRAGSASLVRFSPPPTRIQYASGANCVQALLRAHSALAAPSAPAAGQAFFITDAEPVDTFAFWRPVYEHFGRPLPSLVLPYRIGLLLAVLCELAASLLGLEPPITVKELNHSAVEHYFSIEKAGRLLGYKPIKADVGEVVEYYKKVWVNEYDDKRYGRKYYRELCVWPFFVGLACALFCFLFFTVTVFF